MRFFNRVAFIVLLVCSSSLAQTSSNQFASNKAFAKGGVGIVNPDLFIVVKSSKNELIVHNEHWTGQVARTPELVVAVAGHIYSAASLPANFDISRSIVISFESDKIRFFDFGKMSGGYYERIK